MFPSASKIIGISTALPPGWPQQELQHLSVTGCDLRIVKRLALMLEDWAAQPQASLPEGSRSPAALKACYRLLDNEALDPQDLLASHRAATWERMQSHALVLAVCDTTSFNYTTHPDTTGLGPIGQGNGSAQGFFLHSVVAFSEQGAALGILHTETWARDRNPVSKRKRLARKNSKPIVERESYRWTVAYESVAAQYRAQQAACPKAKLPRTVYVADRESDIYELFVSSAAHDPECGVLVRALHPRRLQEDGTIVWDYLEQLPELGRMKLEVPAQKGRPARVATLALRSASVTLSVPCDKARLFKAAKLLDLWAIEVIEIDAPAGCAPLHWKLLSSTPVPDLAVARRQAGWYARRWGIEVWHRTVKSGCQTQARQLRSREQLERALMLDLIVAWRILALRDASRQSPEAPAAQWLAPEECDVLIAWATKKHPAGQPLPSIAQAVSWISKLGGYLNRKGDGPPGAEVLWRGLTKLKSMTETWILAKLVGND